MTSLLPVLIFCGVVVLLLVVGSRGLSRVNSQDLPPFAKRPGLLNDMESQWFERLVQAAAGHWTVLPKVHLADLIEVPKDRPDHAALAERLAKTPIHFVVCHKRTLEPLLAIVLADGAGDAASLTENELLAAHMPLWRLPPKSSATAAELRDSIRQHLASS